MYSTERDGPPKRPVVTSLTAALKEIAVWQEANQLGKARDLDGLDWQLTVKVTQVPDKTDPKGLLWQVQVGFRTAADAARFIATGTLDAAKDRRLVEIIGSDIVELSMRPSVHQVANEEAARALLVELLPRLKAEFSARPLAEIKRTLIGRWVDDHCCFSLGKRS